jgi:iron complex transport system substrate-binding protein
MNKRIAVVLMTLTALLTACGNDTKSDEASIRAQKTSNYPVTLNSGERETIIDKKPERIVSLSPSATESLFAINAGSQVVAVDSQSTYPDNAPKTDLSGFTPNAEAVLGYKPDLVIAQMDANGLFAALQSANVDILVQPSATSFDDVYKQIADLGIATDRVQYAEDLTTHMRKSIDDKVKAAGNDVKGKSYYHEVDNTYYSSTSSTFIGQVYGLFGMTNIADEAASGGNAYPQLSAEYIVQKNPDYIFLADTKCCAQTVQTVKSRPGWSSLRAVTGDDVVALDDDVASRWGPRVVDLVSAVSTATRTTASNG